MQRSVAKARAGLFKEINIPEIIKLQRLLKSALAQLLPPEKIKEIKKHTKFTVIDTFSESDDKKEESLDHDCNHTHN